MCPPTPPPDDALPIISVASVRTLGGSLVEVVFGLPDMTRRRVVLDRRFATVDQVQWIGRSLPMLVAIQRGEL